MCGWLTVVGMRAVGVYGRGTVVVSLCMRMRNTGVSRREGICRHEAHQQNKYEPELET
jgi:hypothetical protein